MAQGDRSRQAPPPAAGGQAQAGHLWGKPAPDVLYLGMWSHHLLNNNFPSMMADNLIGFSYQGYAAATYRNSYLEQSYVLALRREWRSGRLGEACQYQFGFQAGVIDGYHSSNLILSKRLPLTPYIAPTFSLTIKKHLGVEIAYIYYAFTASLYWQF